MPEIPYLTASLTHIINHPETWNQDTWFCGSKACLAGHMCLAAGAVPCDTGRSEQEDWGVFYRGRAYDPGHLAADLAGLYVWEADWLFNGMRTLPELYTAVNQLERGLAIDAWRHRPYDSDGGCWVDGNGEAVIARHRATTYFRYGPARTQANWETAQYAETHVRRLAAQHDRLTYHPPTLEGTPA